MNTHVIIKYLRVMGVVQNNDLIRNDLIRCSSLVTLREIASILKKSGYEGIFKNIRDFDLSSINVAALACDDDQKILFIRKYNDIFYIYDINENIIHKGKEIDSYLENKIIYVYEIDWSKTTINEYKIKNYKKRFGFFWFYDVIFRYKHLLFEFFLASLFVNIVALIPPFVFQAIFDRVLINNATETLVSLVIILIIGNLFEVLINFFRQYLLTHTAIRMGAELASKAIQTIMKLPTSFFSDKQVGYIITRFQEVDNVRAFLTGSTIFLIIDFLFVIIFISLMIYISLFLTIITLISIPFIVICYAIFGPLLRAKLQAGFQFRSQYQSMLVESLSGIETIKSLSQENNWRKKIERALAKMLHMEFEAFKVNNTVESLVRSIDNLGKAAILFFGASLVIDGSITLGQLVAFNMLAGRVSDPILRLSNFWEQYQNLKVSMSRLEEILDQEPEEDRIFYSDIEPDNYNIKIENVSFSYSENGQNVVDSVNLSVSQGQVIGVVGVSGSGKTTLSKLLSRMYEPSEGSILIGGKDVSKHSVRSVRSLFSYVLQDNLIFQASIAENISMDSTDISLDDVMHAARISGAHEFIEKLPAGYHTAIAERGANLSGGQRQRLSLARAIYSGAPILVLDEATSGLDYGSEKEIIENMAQICEGRTVFLISHRLELVRKADHIIVMEGGKIIEQGTHLDLMETKGEYAVLYNTYS